MTENELYEPNGLPETDTDYEKKPETAQTEAATIKFRTLFLPVLLISINAVFLFLSMGFDGFIPVFVSILGLGCGGIMPTVLIYRYRLDTSKYFPGKMILFALTAAAIAFFLFGKYFSLIMLGAAAVGELAFALFQKTGGKTKLCLILSSAVWGFGGFLLDFWLGYLFY